MMFNGELVNGTIQALGGTLETLSHDGVIAKIAEANYSYIATPTMVYRRFGNNATANQEFVVSGNRIPKRVKNLKKLASDQTSACKHSLTVIDLIGKLEHS